MSNLSRELPANSWLGYSLNLSTMTTLDITAVRVIETTPIPPRLDQFTRAAHTQATRAVLKASRILDYDTEKNLRPVCIGECFLQHLLAIADAPLFTCVFRRENV